MVSNTQPSVRCHHILRRTSRWRRSVIRAGCESFEDVGHSSDARELLMTYLIGELTDVNSLFSFMPFFHTCFITIAHFMKFKEDKIPSKSKALQSAFFEEGKPNWLSSLLVPAAAIAVVVSIAAYKYFQPQK
ncbi:hypothetical protein P5673_028821 [Acropora cervicornis]|uniref:Uncharacterized protein n=1 Tax=Acropora cervicornis TaxID=6130 RepID=A0AAD9PX49_ACRCE|nr:hypothetical protein P5673_028821 [Acropora cervicornis]